MYGPSLRRQPLILACICGLAIGQEGADAPEDPSTGIESTGIESIGVEREATEPRERDEAVTLRIDPIMVSARKWDERSQDVPQSMTILGASTIRDAGIRDMREASYLVPNLHMTEFSSRRLSFPTFRGISTGTGEPAVTTYVDGVPQLDISSANIAMLDVDRIEFLRGPQGTLFGRNSIGGVLKIETRRPGNEHEFSSSASIGNYGFEEYTLHYSGPVVEDRLGLSLSGMYGSRDGYTKNDVTGNRVDSRESLFGRAKLVYTPDDRNEITFTTYGEASNDGGFALGFLSSLRDRPHRNSVDFEGEADREIWANSIDWTFDGDEIRVDALASWNQWDISEASDFDFTALDGVRRYTDESQDAFFTEVRLSSPTEAPIELNDDLGLRWLVGVSGFIANGDESVANEFRPGGAGILFPATNVGTSRNTGDFDDWGIAAFGQATLVIHDRIDLTAGLRYDRERREADILNEFETGGFTVSSVESEQAETFEEFAPTASLGYHATDDVLIYGRVARGFKAGGFNLAAPSGSEVYDQETSWTYAAGVKSSWFDERMILNAEAFYIDWNDLQLSLFDASSGGYVANAGEATSYGFEVEGVARVTEYLDVFGGVGYTEATFDEFTDPYGQDVSDNTLPFVPDVTLHAGAQIHGDLTSEVSWYARGEYIHTGSYELDAGNMESESFRLVNARLGVSWRNVRVEGWIRNAFDDDYVLVAFQPDPTNPSVFVGESGAPQTLGATVSIEF